MVYPDINSVAVQIGPLAVHWYGLMYLVGIFVGWALLVWRGKREDLHWAQNQVGDLVFYAALGIVIGGRLGYVCFYNFPHYYADPIKILYVWDGGMSFHGGLIGVLVACALYAWRHHRHFWDIVDFLAPVVPIGLAAGRLGNFINGELWGKPANLPWAMRLPCAEPRFHMYCDGTLYRFADPTHPGYTVPLNPSQLYELLLEGVALFIICFWFSAKPRPRMAVAGVFSLGYGVFRFAMEFVRLPDPQLGYIAFGWLTMGQILSLPMIGIGIILLVLAYRKGAPAPTPAPVKKQENRPKGAKKAKKA